MARYQGSVSLVLDSQLQPGDGNSVSLEVDLSPSASIGVAIDAIARAILPIEVGNPEPGTTKDTSRPSTSFLLPWKHPRKRRSQDLPPPATNDVLQLRLEQQRKGCACRAVYDESRCNPRDAQRIVQQFVHVAQELRKIGRDSTLQQAFTLSLNDKRQLLRWNSNPPLPIDRCFQDLFMAQVQLDGGRAAVSAWDGELTYKQLDELSSLLAAELQQEKVLPGTIVPLLFEKSYWMTVSMLAVVKIRAVAVCLCSTHPDEAIEAILKQACPPVIVASETQATRLHQMGRDRVIIPQSCTYSSTSPSSSIIFTPANPEDVAFIVFTSGSTGTPKGIVLSHRAISTAGYYVGKRMQVRPDSRVLQFSSYAFDMSIIETWQALTRGACLCIPSETQRLNSMPDFLRSHGVTWAFFTPSTLRNFEPADFPSLKTLVLGGESIGQDLVRRWGTHVRIFNLWGPAEVGPSGAGEIVPTTWIPGTIGTAAGCIAWITAPDDSDCLAPIGTVGEVVMEGAVIAEGYLNDPDRTAQVFIDPPKWRSQFDEIPIQGPFFKTGDLCHYNADGTFRYLSRKDTYVKIRGQRVDTDAVELRFRQLEQGVEIAVAAVTLKSDQGATLVAFVANNAGAEVDWSNRRSSPKLETLPPSCAALARRYQSTLRPHLPLYMIPSFIVPLKTFPRTATDKVDRKRLCGLLETLTPVDLTIWLSARPSLCRDSESRSVLTESEQEHSLTQAVGAIFGIPAPSVNLDLNFLHMGGDSVTAIRVVRMLARENWQLRVEYLLAEDTTLRTVAEKLEQGDAGRVQQSTPRPYSLLDDKSIPTLLPLAAEQCQITASYIEDIYPTTALQEGLVAITETSGSEAYTDRFLFTLPPDCDVNQVRKAWATVVQTTTILRTRIMQATNGQTYQVVCKSELAIPWQSADSVSQFLDHDHSRPMGLGSPLIRLTLIQSSTDSFLALTLHHAIYDGPTLHLCIQRAEQAYRGQQLPRSDFVRFIHHLTQTATDVDTARTFWQKETLHLSSVLFPKHPSPEHAPRATCAVHHDSPRAAASKSLPLASPTAKVRLAWALLLSLYTGSEDVVYGAVVDGRRAPLADIGSIAGPTIATYPVRLLLQREQTVHQAVSHVQDKIHATTPFEQTGLQQIRQMGPEAETACKFQNLLIVQAEDTLAPSPIFGPVEEHLGALNSFPGYPMILLCTPTKGAWKFEMLVDEEVLARNQAEHMLFQLGHLLQELDNVQNQNTPLSQLNLISAQDNAMLTRWNGSPPVQASASIPDLIQAQVGQSPQACAISAWDGDLTYQQVEDYSIRLALQLDPLVRRSGARFVPIFFERSKWVPIAMLAVSMVGAAFALLDPTHPQERNAQICGAVGATVGLTSPSQLKLAGTITDAAWIVVGDKSFRPPPQANEYGYRARLPSSPAPHDLLYAVFTSGSTGTPKGVLIEHGAYCSAIAAQQPKLGITAHSRVLQISSYAFDSFAVEILTVLASGGCVCIPSDEEVAGDLGGAVQRFQANWLCITPSMLRLLTPEAVPSLRTVVAVGESMLPGQIAQWCERVHLLCGYGPTECCTGATAQRITASKMDPRIIGTGMGCLLWAVHPDDVNTLMPANTVGELVLQGPIVGRGYLNDAAKTAESFLDPPAWAEKFHPQGARIYRTGDLVRLNLDGTCSFLGRKNQHTKLRGQRLDLADVERHLLRAFGPEANGMAAVIRPSGSGTTPCLVAFVQMAELPGSGSETPEFQVRARHARDELRLTLPAIMVPELYLQALDLPLMVSGKVNRRLIESHCAELGARDLHALGSLERTDGHAAEELLREHHEPVAWAISQHVAGIITRKTERDELAASVAGRNVDLSRLNLDSIDLMALSQFVHREYQQRLPMATLFRSGLTVREVAEMITDDGTDGLSDTNTSDVSNGTNITNSTNSTNETPSTPAWWMKVTAALQEVRDLPGTDDLATDLPRGKTVFLTGGTGYLGTHILRQLVRDHRVATVYVLVRASSPQSGLARIIQAARTARWWQDDYRRVIEAWPGDLAQSRLGLSAANWGVLCGETVEAIIHNGAVVHWGYDYEVLEAANVGSTLQLLQTLRPSSKPVSFTYVSALVSGDDAQSTDSDAHTPPPDIPDGYTRTKYASELLMTEFARSRPSHRLKIVRPGFIIGSVNDGVANVDDMLWRVVATAMTTGTYNASEPDSWLFVSAVDWVANLIVYETLHAAPAPSSPGSTVARISMTDGISMRDFWQAVSLGLGRKLKPCPVSSEWMAMLEEQIDVVGASHPLLSVMDFLRSTGGCLGTPPASSSSEASPLPVPTVQAASLTNMICQAVMRNAEYLASLEGFAAASGLHSSAVFTRRNKIVVSGERQPV
ncbi:acetyl-CoA synthetase-like protein [Aspergillus brunneoviolaceus CBS 621.78]|uniref:Acetyl-CoA synthetase-like protein n=1 Tax=Aspergillus brunneoviolaceus CBS 621.78 TaxID=1450534 RepID=A0ACD1GPQ5_9EURO|nr:acetyl-CoA synthetase-like protein [Aspergillus brunneoviolaceus CBS 621.78]RAH51236.1 acetyl-CoA synthetase-like protein [Aspergillus brunneoviolaceus CBS 621.78]